MTAVEVAAYDAEVAVWSSALALLRGDKQGAAALAQDAPDPATALVAGECVAEVLRLFASHEGRPVGARRMQRIVVERLQRLAVNPPWATTQSEATR